MKKLMKLNMVLVGFWLITACSENAQENNQTQEANRVLAEQSVNVSADEILKADKDKVRKAIEATEIYQQDGYQLTFDKAMPDCANCYRFTFKHYGDPMVEYSFVGKVKSDGSVELEHTTFSDVANDDMNGNEVPADYFEITLLRALMKESFDYYGGAELVDNKALDLYGGSSNLMMALVSYKPKSLLDGDGKVLYLYDKDSKEVLIEHQGHDYQLLPVFANGKPFLLFPEVTNKGNGVHRLYGVEQGKIKNFLSNKGWSVQTIGRPDMQHIFEPKELTLSIADMNQDNLEDLVFSGEQKNINDQKNNACATCLSV